MNGVPDTYVGAGDFQFYVPLERWEIDRSRIMSVVVTLWCEFKDLFDLIQRVRSILGEAGYEDKAQISIKSFYLYDDARHFLEDIKGGQLQSADAELRRLQILNPFHINP